MVLTIQYGRMWWCFFGVVVESAKARKSGRREVSRQYVCIHIYEGHVIHLRVPLDSQHDDDHVLSCQKERGSFLPSSLIAPPIPPHHHSAAFRRLCGTVDLSKVALLAACFVDLGIDRHCQSFATIQSIPDDDSSCFFPVRDVFSLRARSPTTRTRALQPPSSPY